jgi:hypothetical protein
MFYNILPKTEYNGSSDDLEAIHTRTLCDISLTPSSP